jgi:hypothetical protein
VTLSRVKEKAYYHYDAFWVNGQTRTWLGRSSWTSSNSRP